MSGSRNRSIVVRTLRFLAAALALLSVAPVGAPAAGPDRSHATTLEIAAAQSSSLSSRARPAHFRLTAAEAIALARGTDTGRVALRRDPAAHPHASTPDLGLWRVTFEHGGQIRAVVDLEDRTGKALEPSAWEWPLTGTPMSSVKRHMELILLALGALFLAFFIDWRRPRSWRTVDGVVLVAGFAPAFALADRAQPLTAYPLVYPALVYLVIRLLVAGVRGPTGAGAWFPPPIKVLLPALVLLASFRVGYNLLEGHVNDVGYAGVAGADAILHGFPVYTADNNHLDTYGPLAYLAYVPASLVFPMDIAWSRDSLSAAHATAVACDLGTLALLVVLGRRARSGRAGTRLGLGLAVLYAACPWTFFPLAMSTNDGLLALLLVATLVVMRSAPLRGAMLGLAAATKISPVALLPLIAGGGRPSASRAARCATVFGAVVLVSALAYLPEGGLQALWHETIGFQMRRRSFLSLWGQYPELEPVQTVVKAAVVVLAAGIAVRPRTRDLGQVAALAGAVVAALQLTVVFWSFFYLAWLVPFMLAAVVLREERVTVEVPQSARAVVAAPPVLQPA